MKEKNISLTSLEIRSLLLDTLAYEDSDLDNVGNTFRKHDYQGGQANLFRLAESLAIKRNMINSYVPAFRTTWGSDGFKMIEGKNTNFSRSEILKLQEEFHFLLNQGIISPGTYEAFGDSLPYFHVTEYGKECLKVREILPHDPDEYIKRIAKVSNINEWVLFYIKEAIQCFNANCLEASIIMVGLANEKIMDEQIDTLGLFLQGKYCKLKNDMDKALKGENKVSRKYNIYQNFLQQVKEIHKDPNYKELSTQNDSLSATVYANFTRITRNELAHPSQVRMERVEVLMIFISFIKYCGIQYKFINYFKNSNK